MTTDIETPSISAGPLLQDDGNAYRLQEGVLMSAAVSLTGLIDEESWCEVDFDRIGHNESMYLRSIQVALVAQHRRNNEL